MCGFFGNFAHNGNKIIANSRLKEISNFISHRGPDGEGFYEDQNVSLAFKRLSINLIEFFIATFLISFFHGRGPR